MNRELDPTKCYKTIYSSDIFYSGHQCERKPVVTRDGRPYCKIHDPEYIKIKNAKWQAKWDKKWAERKIRGALAEARQKAIEGLTLEELKQVTPHLIRQKILTSKDML